MPRSRADAQAIALFAALVAVVISAKLTEQRGVPSTEQHAVPSTEEHAVPPAEAHVVPSAEQHAIPSIEQHTTPFTEQHTSPSTQERAIALVEEPFETSVTITGAVTPANPTVAAEANQSTTKEPEQQSILTRYKESLIRPAHDRVVMQFTPPILRAVLARAAEYFRAPVLVTSAYRSPPYNRRVGGVRRSMHMVRDGKRGAVDFKVVGVSKTTLYAWAKRQPEVNGIGLYCRSDFIHVDNGQKRSWYWGCGRSRHAKRTKRVRVAGAVARPSGSDH
jgi:uncharacterized protein YcbK (DUF882 family)